MQASGDGVPKNRCPGTKSERGLEEPTRIELVIAVLQTAPLATWVRLQSQTGSFRSLQKNHAGKLGRMKSRQGNKRETRLELATSSLGSWRSTIELLPQGYVIIEWTRPFVKRKLQVAAVLVFAPALYALWAPNRMKMPAPPELGAGGRLFSRQPFMYGTHIAGR